MDASDFEADVWLQKASVELLADLRHSLPKLLRKPADASGTARLRYQVRMREVSRLDSLVRSLLVDHLLCCRAYILT